MRHLVTAAFFAAALAAYLASASAGWIGALFVVGMLCEGIAWFRLMRRDKPPPHS